MPNRDLLEYWHYLHDKQSEWAFRAYNSLVMTLSEDVQKKLILRDEAVQPYVVIFGKTQVGKTTLLLDLMGINPNQMQFVSEVMRGGREYGKSATATAMEYGNSYDDRWGLTIQKETNWFNSDQAMTKALGKIREDMENGRLTANSPCIVHIPNRFFYNNCSNAPKVRILDLPGDNPANEQEQRHVSQMAKAYLPFADLILLVGRGDDLGFLRPEVITLPEIEDWQAMPYHFRIVTTYSYTAKSVRDLLRDNANIDESTLRQRLIQEIQRFGSMSEAAKNESLYFPLEFGNSWMNARTNEPELYQKISPIITRLRSQLIDQIAKTSTSTGRLRNILNAHHSIIYIRKKKTESIKSNIKNLNHKEIKLNNNLKHLENIIRKIQKKLENVNKEIKVNELFIEEGEEKIKHTDTFRDPDFCDNKNNRKILQKLILNYISILSDMEIDFSKEGDITAPASYFIKIKKNIPKTEKSITEKTLNEYFHNITQKLDDYWFDKYLIPENFEKDLTHIKKLAEIARKELITQKKSAWITALKEKHNEDLDKQKKLEIKLELYEQEHIKTLQKKNKIKNEQHTMREKLELISKHSEEDLERCEHFEYLLNEEYLKEIKERERVFYETSDNCDALLQLFSFVELKHHREDLMALSKQNIH